MVFMLLVSLTKLLSLAMGYNISPPNNIPDNEIHPYDFPFVSRSQWNARSPIETLPLPTPVSYVVIHHSYLPASCWKREECERAMKSMQNFHMDDRGWWDIGYSFGVGSDGTAYEGRGWRDLGAHALNFNSVSVGICLIGDWRNELPPDEQMRTAKELIAAGVKQGYIKPNYKLVGHRQVRDTECPGDALFEEIKKWKNYSTFPASKDDLLSVPELSEKTKNDIRAQNANKTT